jgi:hypothetical protein
MFCIDSTERMTGLSEGTYRFRRRSPWWWWIESALGEGPGGQQRLSLGVAHQEAIPRCCMI